MVPSGSCSETSPVEGTGTSWPVGMAIGTGIGPFAGTKAGMGGSGVVMSSSSVEGAAIDGPLGDNGGDGPPPFSSVPMSLSGGSNMDPVGDESSQRTINVHRLIGKSEIIKS